MDCFELDVHTHSVSSGHYTEDTVTDMIKHASGIGLKLLGISEHGPKLPNSCGLSYFRPVWGGSEYYGCRNFPWKLGKKNGRYVPGYFGLAGRYYETA